ncbi:MAG: hypothetical protein V3V08_22065 [Nannocystaceae bacterium]
MITILDVAKARGVHVDDDGTINGAEFERVGLPFLGGCQVCEACIAPYNAHPGRNGYLIGSCCAQPDDTFETVEEFEAAGP